MAKSVRKTDYGAIQSAQTKQSAQVKADLEKSKSIATTVATKKKKTSK